MADKIKVTCAKCGEEFDLDSKWEGFAKKYPDRVTCPHCKDGSKSATKAAANTTKKEYSKTSPTKSPVTAELFVKAYDELTAAFADRLDEVKDYLGGWVSTIVINRSK